MKLEGLFVLLKKSAVNYILMAFVRGLIRDNNTGLNKQERPDFWTLIWIMWVKL